MWWAAAEPRPGIILMVINPTNPTLRCWVPSREVLGPIFYCLWYDPAGESNPQPPSLREETLPHGHWASVNFSYIVDFPYYKFDLRHVANLYSCHFQKIMHFKNMPILLYLDSIHIWISQPVLNCKKKNTYYRAAKFKGAGASFNSLEVFSRAVFWGFSSLPAITGGCPFPCLQANVELLLNDRQ